MELPLTLPWKFHRMPFELASHCKNRRETMSPAKALEPTRAESITPLQMIQAAIEKGIDPDKLMTFAERYERNRAA